MNNSYTSYVQYCQRIDVQPMNEPMWRMMYGDSGGDNHVAGQFSAASRTARNIESANRTTRPKEPTKLPDRTKSQSHRPTDRTTQPTEPQQQADIAQFLSNLWPR